MKFHFEIYSEGRTLVDLQNVALRNTGKKGLAAVRLDSVPNPKEAGDKKGDVVARLEEFTRTVFGLGGITVEGLAKGESGELSAQQWILTDPRSLSGDEQAVVTLAKL